MTKIWQYEHYCCFTRHCTQGSVTLTLLDLEYMDGFNENNHNFKQFYDPPPYLYNNYIKLLQVMKQLAS